MVTSTSRRNPEGADRGGRPARTSARELAEVAQRLFLERGFEAVSVADIAAVAGVSRRTFFRYFPTKADVLWVESDREIALLRTLLAAAAADEPYDDVLVRAVPAALAHRPEQRDWALHRARLVLAEPAVQGQAAVRHAQWRAVATEFTAERLALTAGDPFPLAVGHGVLAATLAGHEHWIAHPTLELTDVLERFLRLMLPRLPEAPGERGRA